MPYRRSAPYYLLLSGSVVLITIGSLFLSNSSTAQAPHEPIIASSNSIINISWSNDGTSLTFQTDSYDTGVVSDDGNNWHEYRIETGRLTTSSLWPQPRILPQGLPIGQFQAPPANSFTFISPDGRYLAYPAVRPEGDRSDCSPFGLANLETYSGIYVENIRLCAGGNFNINYEVVWSDDGTAFTVFTTYPETAIYYATNYEEDIKDVIAINLSELTDENSGESLYVGYIFDLSPDGSQVLAEQPADDPRLVVWDANNQNQIRTLAQNETHFAGAAFSPDGRNVRYVAEQGLTEYDLASGETRVLDPNVNTTWANKGWFSPDSRHIALLAYDERRNNDFALYVVEVPEGAE
jgi:hypothetical protein